MRTEQLSERDVLALAGQGWQLGRCRHPAQGGPWGRRRQPPGYGQAPNAGNVTSPEPATVTVVVAQRVGVCWPGV